jgi:endonuclease/exonuclease/phosphatase family metal-dependent hydrolase
MERQKGHETIDCHIVTYNVHGLPWSRHYIQEIGTWLSSKQIPIVCLQEVFTESGRSAYKNILERAGYEVHIPRDTGVCLLPSGLMIAVLESRYRVLSNCFQSFLEFNNVEIMANKGFYTLWLQDRQSGRRIHITNTHTQSDTEISWLFGGKKAMDRVRYRQGEQILKYFESVQDPVLVAGDFNKETSIHPHIRLLHPQTSLPIKKSTFMSTGEDLDHIAWLPLQYAKDGCGFCDIRRKGPQYVYCKVHELPWSDHAAVEAVVQIVKYIN